MTEHLIYRERLRIAAEAAGAGAVPPREGSLPRLNDRTLQVLGWTRGEEIFGATDIQAALQLIKTPKDRGRFCQALIGGEIAEIRRTAEEIMGVVWRSGAGGGFWGLVDDYLAEFTPNPAGRLSPRSESGIY